MNLISERIKKLRHRAYIEYFRRLPIENNKVICWSNNMKSYGCNPKYLTEYLLKHFPGKYDIVWVFNEETPVPDELPDGVRTVRYFSIDYLRELHTAKIIVTNARMAEWLCFYKRKEQFYIQTWHSSLRLKKIEGDADMSESYIKSAQKDSEKIDLLISGCRFSTEIFKRAFWYNGKIFECGTPRCDVFFENSSEAERFVREKYRIDENIKIALYAPTFRKNFAADDYGIDYSSVKAALERRFGKEFCLIYRFHPNVIGQKKKQDIPWLIDGTGYHDMQQLLAASDVLITDYSSCMFDAVIAGKLCFLYTPDIDEYTNNERGLYFDIDKLPFFASRSNDGLCRGINEFDLKRYNDGISSFLKQTGSFEDGNACRRISDVIREKCFPDTVKNGGN